MFQFFSKTWNGVRTYLCDKEQSYGRIIHFARLSILINAAIGLGKIIIGLVNHSFLFFISGFYNIGLSFAKAVAVKGYSESKEKPIWPFTREADNSPSEKNKKKEYHYYQLVGMIVLLASLAYMIGSIGVFVGERSNTHFGAAMAALIGSITAVEIIVSLQGILLSYVLYPLLQVFSYSVLVLLASTFQRSI